MEDPKQTYSKEEIEKALLESQVAPDYDLQEENQKERQQLQEETDAKKNEDGSLKSSWELKEAKDFGVGENIEDAGRAVVTGVQNVWNNTIDLGRYLDPEYYSKEKGPEYSFASDWKFNGQVMPKTRWGGFIRDLTDFGVGMFGVGKIGMGIKGIRGLMMAGKTVDRAGKVTNVAGKAAFAKRLGADAVKGAVVDVWDTNMTESETYFEQFIKANPSLAENLDINLGNGRDLSPAQRAGLNVFEGMGIGAVFGAALEGAGLLYRRFTDIPNNKITEPTKNISDSLSTIKKTLDEQEVADYNKKAANVEIGARKKYEADTFKSLKKSKALPEDITIDQFRELKELPNGKPRWDQLPEMAQYDLMETYAKGKDIDWGDLRDYSRYLSKQQEQALEIGADQLEVDLNKGTPRNGAYYAADKTEYQNQPLSSGDPNPMKSVRDMISIRTNLQDRRGTPTGVVREAQINRIANNSELSIDQIRTLASAVAQDANYTDLYKGRSSDEMIEDYVRMSSELQAFLGPNGRVATTSPEELMDFIYASDGGFEDIFFKNRKEGYEGIRALTASQLQMLDVVYGQLTNEIKDLARGSFSIDEFVDSRIPGGMGDAMFNRLKVLQQERARTSAFISARLRDFRSNKKTSVKEVKEMSDKAAKRAEELVNLAIDVIRQDETGGLFDAFRYFAAASGGSKMTMNDMVEFFNRKFKGGMVGNKANRNMIVNEMMTMGINSMLSGPKTPVRAVLGTSFNSVMRPAATIAGTLVGGGDRRTRMAAMAELNGMFSSLGEAWEKAVADYNTFFDNGGNYRDYVKNAGVDEFEAIRGFYQNKGTAGDKALFNTYSIIRGLNQLPIVSYGSRILRATDVFFGQLIHRGVKRSEAFLEVYDSMQKANGALGPVEMKAAIREAESRFNKKVWTANGKLTDDFANYKWKEAALTTELGPRAQKLNQLTESLPLIKPFVGLFMTTGVNALTMMTKYTPVLNTFVKEVSDIRNLPLGHERLTKLGITTADQLAEARAVIKGREVIGMGFVGLASSLYLSGNISGNGPPDLKLRKQWEQQTGWQPRSIKIGNKWVSYEALEPFNTILAYVADTGDLSGPMGEQWTNNRLAQLGYVLMQGVVNKTFLHGMMNVADLITGKGQSPEAIAANLVNNQIPWSSMRNEIGKVINPGMRELQGGFMETIRGRNVWVEAFGAPELPMRRDIFTGKPLRMWDPMTRMLNAVLPFNINTTGSQTQDYLFRSSVNLHQEFTTAPGSGIDLTEHPDIMSRFQELLANEKLEEKFTRLFSQPDIIQSILDMEAAHDAGTLNSPNDSLHAVQIRQIFYQAKLNAWDALKKEDGRIAELEKAKELEQLEKSARQSGRADAANRFDDAQKILDIKK